MSKQIGFLKKILKENIAYLKSGNMMGIDGTQLALPSISIRMALAIIAMIPVTLIFPFIQKSLIRGVVTGGLKG